VSSRQRTPAASSKAQLYDAGIEPLVLSAVADVDRSLLRWSLDLPPRERLRACSRAAATFARLRRAASSVR